MLYLIGGPPKCGKTTLAKKLSKKLGIPWIASDTLEVIARKYTEKYISQKEFDALYPKNAHKGKTNDKTYHRNTPKQIARHYRKQAKATYDAIDMVAACQIADGNDYVVEGYHVTPELAARLIKKYGSEHFRVLFLIKSDASKFMRDVAKSTTTNDWILSKTKDKATFSKIAEMVVFYAQIFQKEASRHGFKVLNMDDDFTKQLSRAIIILSKEPAKKESP